LLDRSVESQQPFICLNSKFGGFRERQVYAAPTPFLGYSGLSVVNERVAHGQSRGAQKVSLIGKAAGGSQTQERLMDQGGCLEGLIATQA